LELRGCCHARSDGSHSLQMQEAQMAALLGSLRMRVADLEQLMQRAVREQDWSESQVRSAVPLRHQLPDLTCVTTPARRSTQQNDTTHNKPTPR
jgi:hypothetical protein